MNIAKSKYNSQRSTSKCRNIPFLLTFEEWYDWWLSNGIDKNQLMVPFTKQTFCMCRYGDKGPYSLNNIYCDTVSNNTKIMKRNNTGNYGACSKPIQTPKGKFNSLKQSAEYYQVNISTIHRWLKSKPNDFYYL